MPPERTGVEGFDWLDAPTELAARRLLGCELEHDLGREVLRVRIVETEAYDQDDEASHAFRGPTARNATMFGAAGHLYVYRIHGHHCCNVVTGRAGYGQGALVRAAEPILGEPVMSSRRGRGGYELTNGPGKVCQALGITSELDGHDLAHPPLRLVRRPPLPDDEIVVSTRIGISRAVDAPRRFHVLGNPYVSKGRQSRG
ncbi:DNA-3-methyladenine glycosylase [Nocardioides sp. CCNWLW239]|uniref:DNA-3-methyladenine glycosylase n=1 Tax=Nocardioides sp. CCNWLW239 TaxID=3128902 RepID=UPI003018C80E